jgi:hypothetical protein
MSRVRWYEMLISTYPTIFFGAEDVSCTQVSDLPAVWHAMPIIASLGTGNATQNGGDYEAYRVFLGTPS